MSHLLLTGGEAIYYRLIGGSGDCPHLVFLHEGLGCGDMWKDFPDRLCGLTGCPGLVYDRLGYGKSSPLNRTRTVHYMHEYALNELPQVIEGIIPGKPFILIGHSDGGTINLIFGAEKPSFLKAAITEAAHVFVEPETVRGIEETVKAYEQGRLSGLSKYHGDKTDEVFRAWSDTWLSPWFRHWNIEYALPSVDRPLLVIQGVQDQYATLGQVDSIVSKSAGEARAALVDDCGHSPHHEQPEEVMQLMSEFIEEHR